MSDQPPLSRPPTTGQLAAALPGPTTYVTTHARDGTAVVHSSRPAPWITFDDEQMEMAVAWTTDQFPADLSGDRDIAAHDARVAEGATGLVVDGGTVLRYVDFAPSYTCIMHCTDSVDYGIVLEGTIVAVLDSGQTVAMGRGDSMVQRATMHAWRNPSSTEWARMVFCLQHCAAPTTEEDQAREEDLGRGTAGVPPSGNDGPVFHGKI